MGLKDFFRSEKPATAPGARRLLLVGHSHLVALELGLQALKDSAPDALAGVEIRTANLREEAYQLKGFRPGVAASLPAALRDLVKAFRPDRIILVLQGNEHNVLSLIEHPRPFDFILPDAPELPLDETRELLTYDAVAAVFRDMMRPSVHNLIDTFRALNAAPLAHIETPPPMPEQHVRNHPGVFRAKLQECGVAPLPMRYKMWRARTAQLHEICAQLGTAVIPLPADVLAADLSLKAEMRAADASHGNAAYGALAVRSIIAFDRQQLAAGSAT